MYKPVDKQRKNFFFIEKYSVRMVSLDYQELSFIGPITYYCLPIHADIIILISTELGSELNPV